MPSPRTKNYKLSTLNQRVALKLFQVSSLLFLVFSLSACSLVGTNKSAALQVTSTPEASIFLEGKHIGKTPFFSDQLKSGSYTLKVTASGSTYVDKIDLFPGALTVVNRELNDNFMAQSGEVLWLEKGKNDVFVATSPSDAEITVDGKYKGKTPIIVSDLQGGDHKVLVSKHAYIDREFAIKTSDKYKLIANVTLASQIAKNPTSAGKAQQPDVKKVEIAKTPQGFLRVRKEPALDAPEIGRVNSQDQVEVIQETEDWLKISFDGKLGWISSQYTKKI